MRPTFTLHSRFRYARSTFFDLYLNYKSNLRVLLTGAFGTLCTLTFQRHAHFVPEFGDYGAMGSERF